MHDRNTNTPADPSVLHRQMLSSLKAMVVLVGDVRPGLRTRMLGNKSPQEVLMNAKTAIAQAEGQAPPIKAVGEIPVRVMKLLRMSAPRGVKISARRGGRFQKWLNEQGLIQKIGDHRWEPTGAGFDFAVRDPLPLGTGVLFYPIKARPFVERFFAEERGAV